MRIKLLLVICLIGSLAFGIMNAQAEMSFPTWRYAVLSVGAHFPSETGGPSASEAVEFGSDETYYGINMDAGETIQISIPGMPGGYAAGTPIYVSIFSFATTGTGANTWKVKGQAIDNGGALSGTWGSAVSISDTIASVNLLYKSDESTAITIANSPVPGDFWQLNIELDVENSTVTYYAGLVFKYHSTN